MNVALTDEQREWESAVARLADAHATTSADQLEAIDVDRGWAAAVEVGITSLRAPELAGTTATGVESMLAVEQAGRRLCALPILGQGVLAPELLAAAGATEASAAVASGALRVAPGLRRDLGDLAQLGEEAIAFDAAGATHALVRDGQRLAAVALDGDVLDGLDLTRRLVAIPADKEPTPLSFDLGAAISDDRLSRVRAVALTALAADLLGVMAAAVHEAVAYATDRTQFGVAIGTFQAVQHLLADAAVAVEGARSCLWHAAWACDHESTVEAEMAARTAKAYASAAGVRVVETTVQVFGGIAITWEHLSHVRLRRVHLDRVALGDEDHHHRAIARGRLARSA